MDDVQAPVAPTTPTIDPAIAQRMQGMANVPFPSVQGSYPIPKDNSLTGDNWARNLMLFGGAMQDANDARFGQGFLLHPGGGFASGLAGGIKRVSDVDNQNAQTQSFLGTAETNRIANAQSMYHLALQREGMQSPETPVRAQSAGGEGPMSGSPIQGPSGQSGGYSAVSPERLLAWSNNSAKKAGAPASFGQLFGYGILPTESNGNPDPSLQNKAGDFGIAGLSLATVKNPGFGMKGGDPEFLKRNPEAAVDFAVDYAYRVATAPVAKGGLGLTAQDLDGSNPGYLAAVAAKYGGAQSPEGKQAYVGRVANNVLRNTGRQQLASTMPYQDMLAQAWQGVNSGQTASAPTASAPANQRAGMQQVQAAQTATTQPQTPAPPATGIGGGGPDAAARDQPKTREQLAAEWAAYNASHNIPVEDGGPAAPPSGPDLSEGTPAAPQAAPKGVQFAGPGATDTPSPAPTPAPAAAVPPPVAQTQTAQAAPPPIPLAPPTGNPVPQPGSRADIQSGQPSQVGEQQIRDAAQQRFNQAAQLRTDANAIAKMGQFSGNKYQQDQAAAMRLQAQKLDEEGMQLQTTYLTKKAEQGTWEEAGVDPTTHAPMMRNTATGEKKPLFTGDTRAFPLPGLGGKTLVARPGGAYEIIDANTPAIAQTHLAETQGSNVGKDLADTQKTVLATGPSSNTAMNNIDHTETLLNAAARNKAPTGYFAPIRLQLEQIGRELGWTPKGLDMSPNMGLAQGADSTAQLEAAKKGLSFVTADFWHMLLGPGSQITEGKINALVDAHPSILLRDTALRDLLNYARQQYAWDHAWAEDGRKHIVNGILDPNWPSQYQDTHGTGPVFDPNTGETHMPGQVKGADGQTRPEGPSLTPIPAPQPAPPAKYPTPNRKDTNFVRAHPEQRDRFEQTFGPAGVDIMNQMLGARPNNASR